MIKEAIYRSPKWLRNFIDFEVSTGDDIKGERSKSAILKEWDKKYRSIMSNNESSDSRSEFIEFYYTEIEKLYSNNYINNMYWNTKNNFKEKYRGDFSIFDKFDNWKKEKEEIKRKNKEILDELDVIYDEVLRDFRKNTKRECLETDTSKGIYKYIFTDGRMLTIAKESGYRYSLHFNGFKYSLSETLSNKFLKLIIHILNNSEYTSYNKSGTNSSSSNKGSGNKGSGSSNGYNQKDRSNSNENSPKLKLYNTLKSTIKQREDQLKKMPYNDPDRKSMENELDNAKRKLSEMKSKYKFEKISNFFKFKNL